MSRCVLHNQPRSKCAACEALRGVMPLPASAHIPGDALAGMQRAIIALEDRVEDLERALDQMRGRD